jgi:hypothetical protein
MIRVGIGGWVFAPWRGTFSPKGLSQADELTYASRHVTSIEKGPKPSDNKSRASAKQVLLAYRFRAARWGGSGRSLVDRRIDK